MREKPWLPAPPAGEWVTQLSVVSITGVGERVTSEELEASVNPVVQLLP